MKGVIIIPCMEKVNATRTATMYHQNMFRWFGLLDKFLSDRGPQFDSNFLKDLWKLTGVERQLSTAYHPQTDGETERMNCKIEAYLRIFCSNHPHDWSEYITNMEFAFNNQEHSVTKHSLFFLMYGSYLKGLPTSYAHSRVSLVNEWLWIREKAHEKAQSALEHATAQMAKRLNQGFSPFQEEQKVWLEMTHHEDGCLFKKLASKRHRPFRIQKVLSRLMYKLALPSNTKIHPVIHTSLLTPYHEMAQHNKNFLEPPPDIVDGQEEYEVEAILAHRLWYGNMWYLVRWKDCPTAENSWKPEGHLKNASEILMEYKKRKQLTVTRQPTIKSTTTSTSKCLPPTCHLHQRQACCDQRTSRPLAWPFTFYHGQWQTPLCRRQPSWSRSCTPRHHRHVCTTSWRRSRISTSWFLTENTSQVQCCRRVWRRSTLSYYKVNPRRHHWLRHRLQWHSSMGLSWRTYRHRGQRHWTYRYHTPTMTEMDQQAHQHIAWQGGTLRVTGWDQHFDCWCTICKSCREREVHWRSSLRDMSRSKDLHWALLTYAQMGSTTFKMSQLPHRSIQHISHSNLRIRSNRS